MKKKKSGTLIVVLSVVFIIALAFFFEWEIGAYLHKDSVAKSTDELSSLISKQIDEGKESATIYTTNISEDDIANINFRIYSMNGSVSEYRIVGKTHSGMKVKFRYDISDNYYVCDKFLNGVGIPADRPKAHKLYEKVCEILENIITDDMSDYEKELAIHDYIVENCSYGYTDVSKEYAYRAYGCLIQNKAVCNGYAEAFSLLLTCAGVENCIVTGNGKEELHAWNQVCLDGKWYNVDITWNDPIPDKGTYSGHVFFNVSDEIMEIEHTWEKEDFNECRDMDMNYYVFNNEIYDYDRMVELVASISSQNPYATIEIMLSDYTPEKYQSFAFINENPGINFFSFSIYEYGDYCIVVIDLNKKE